MISKFSHPFLIFVFTARKAMHGAIIIQFLLLLMATSAFSSDFPDGWRKATPKELKSFLNLRDGSKSKYTEAHADFNGDGKIDSAYLLKSTKFSGQGLLVKLSTGSSYKWIEVDVINWDQLYPDEDFGNVSLSMAIEVLSPKDVKKYIKESTWELGSDELKPEDYKNPAIDYFKFMSAGSIIYWSQSENKFKRYWYSD